MSRTVVEYYGNEKRQVLARLVALGLLIVLCAALVFAIVKKRQALILQGPSMAGEFSLYDVFYGMTKLPAEGPLALTQEQLQGFREQCGYLREERRLDGCFTRTAGDVLTGRQLAFIAARAGKPHQMPSLSCCRRVIDGLRRTSGAGDAGKLEIPGDVKASEAKSLLPTFIFFHEAMEKDEATRQTAETARRALPYVAAFRELLQNDNALQLAELFTADQRAFIRKTQADAAQERPDRGALREGAARLLWPPEKDARQEASP